MADEWGNKDANDYEFDGEAFSTDDLGGSGDNVNREGWYHLEVMDVVPDLDTTNKKGEDRSPSIRFDMQVLETVNGQSPQGAKHFHRIYVGGKKGMPAADGSIKSAFRFGLGLGLLREVERDGKKMLVDSVTGLTKINFATWQRAKGMQCCAFIKQGEDDPKFGKKFEIPFARVYQVDDPHVADTPKNQEMLALIGKSGAAAKSSGASVANGSKQPAREAVTTPSDF